MFQHDDELTYGFVVDQEMRLIGVITMRDLLLSRPDQRLDCGVCFRDRGENLPAAVRRLDISKADFEMPLAVLTAPDEDPMTVRGAAGLIGCSCQSHFMEASNGLHRFSPSGSDCRPSGG